MSFPKPVAVSYPGAEHDAAWRAALAPEDYANPTPQSEYHLVVIGAGPAGLISAIGAAGLGAKVALVERHFMGGDCLNVGCVPSKALLAHSKAQPGRENFAEAFRWLREVRAGIAPHDSVARYTEAGVDVFLGEASFVDAQRVQVSRGGEQVVLNARRTVICTGARAAVPPIPGLRESSPLTNEEVFDLTEAPSSIAILGAGAIGCELSQVFARLGVEVHLFELAPRVLPLESEEASAAVAKGLANAGVHIHVGQGVESVSGEGLLQIKAGDVNVSVEKVMVALGRRPNVEELNLEAAGVKLTERGLIEVDEKLRTANKAIFAAGDCASALQFTHHADAQARIVIQNALFAPTAKADGLIVPHCTYTQPEVASVGESEASLKAANVEYDTFRVGFDELDRGRAELGDAGYAEVFCKKGTDEILGASIVGPDAGEQIASVCLLMSNGLGLSKAVGTILSYPTRSEYIKRLGDAYNRTRLTPFAAKAIKGWLKFLSR